MVLVHCAIGLLSALVLWAFSYSLGSLLILSAPWNRTRNESASEPIDVLVASAFGFAAIMLMVFVLLVVHGFYPIVTLGSFFLAWAIAFALSARRFGRAETLRALILSLRVTAEPAWLGALVVALILSAPAILPPDSYDSTMYHFAYAVDWSNSHFLKLDPYLRFPLAQFNIELLFALFFSLHLVDYVQFVTWTFFAVAATGIARLTSTFLRDAGARPLFAGLAGFATSCVFMFSPIVLRCADVGLVDVPAGAMLLAFGSAGIGAKRNFNRYALPMAAIGGSFIGIKLAFAPSFLLFALVIISLAREQKVARNGALLAIAVLIVFTSPWFARNLVVAGDPVDPIINLALHRPDPFWNQVDLDAQKGDLHREIPLLADPLWLYLNPGDAQGAASLSFCFFYVPFACVGILLLNRRLRANNGGLFLLCSILIFEITLQLLVSNRLTRYTLQFYPLFLVSLSTITWLIFRWLFERLTKQKVVWIEAGALAAIALYALPPPQPIIEYNNLRAQFALLDLGVNHPKAQLSKTFGYTEAEDLATLISQARSDASVLTINFEYLAYFFREKGVVSLGDWWGQARLREFVSAVDSEMVPQYMNRFGIGAVMIRRRADSVSVDEEAKMISAIENDGFEEVTLPESDVREFIKGDILASAENNGSPRRERLASNQVDLEQSFPYGQIGLDPTRHFEPGDRSANIFQVVDGDQTVNSITIISGNTISFGHLAVAKDSILTFDVAKIWPLGAPAVAWVDVTRGNKRTRIFNREMQPASGEEPTWEHVAVPVPFDESPATLTLGVSSLPSGGIADWVAFVRPILSDSKFLSKKIDPVTQQLSVTDVVSPQLPKSNDFFAFIGSLLKHLQL